ncbi:hypothetical protein TrST_g9097 [Triparma strigata]|uniref:Uncharacterized protein n=1 Tax=Triparma strigata TaxID=1606541 RepID=A0A9W7A584_9STRA|nr:hypothetical protein TrST_g9097 [Triparma strigata]
MAEQQQQQHKGHHHQAHHRESLPHHIFKHNSGTLAKLDLINHSLLDSVKIPNKRSSPIGGILSVLSVVALLYFGAQTFWNTNFEPTTETEVQITYGSPETFEIQCEVEKCYVYVKWGPEFMDSGECQEFVTSKQWSTRSISNGKMSEPELLQDYWVINEVGDGEGRRRLDCSGEGTSWGPGIAPPPEGCSPGDGSGGSSGSGGSEGTPESGGSEGTPESGGGSGGGSEHDGSFTPKTCFESRCIPLVQDQILKIDNFAVMTNPKGGGVHVMWDINTDRLGAAIPAHLSATGDHLKLFDGAHFMMKLTQTDEILGTKEKVTWLNEFSQTINDTPIESVCPEVSEFDIKGRAEIYFKPTAIKTTRIDNDIIYSVVGEIGGYLDIIIYAATGLMFVFWSIEKCYYKKTHKPKAGVAGIASQMEVGMMADARDSQNLDSDFAIKERGGTGAML